MDEQNVTAFDLLQYMQKFMPMKQDLERFATKDDLQLTKTDILTSVDAFVKLHQTLDQELVAMRAKYERLEERLEILERKLQIA